MKEWRSRLGSSVPRSVHSGLCCTIPVGVFEGAMGNICAPFVSSGVVAVIVAIHMRCSSWHHAANRCQCGGASVWTVFHAKEHAKLLFFHFPLPPSLTPCDPRGFCSLPRALSPAPPPPPTRTPAPSCVDPLLFAVLLSTHSLSRNDMTGVYRDVHAHVDGRRRRHVLVG